MKDERKDEKLDASLGEAAAKNKKWLDEAKKIDEPSGVLAGPKSKEDLAKIMAEIEATVKANNEEEDVEEDEV